MPPPADFPNGIKIGNVVLDAVKSQHGDVNGRLRIKGTKGNGAELQFEPADDFKGPGVVAQFLMFTNPDPLVANSEARFCVTVQRESNNADGTQGPDKVMIDSDSHEGRASMPIFIMIGGITKADGQEIPGKLVVQVSPDGTIEAWDQRGPGTGLNGAPPWRRLRYDIPGELKRLGAVSG